MSEPAHDNAYDLTPAWLPLPKLYATEKIPAPEKIVHIKLFTPDSSWTWLLVEYKPEEDLAFGYACDAGYPDGAEWGYISIAELRTLRGKLGLRVERDIWFKPQTFAEAARKELDGNSKPEAVEPEAAVVPPPVIVTRQEQWIQHTLSGTLRTNAQKNQWSADLTAYALNGGDLMAASMVGSGTELDGIRGNVTMGKALTIILKGSHDGASQYSVSTKDNRYTLFKTRLHRIRKDHYILLNNLLTQPQLDEETVYVMGHFGERESDMIGRGLRQYVPVAVLPGWYAWLVEENKKLTSYLARIRQLTGQGFRIYSIPLKACNWAELVKMGLETQAIAFEVPHGSR